MYFQLKGQTIDYSLLKTGFLWVILFSLTNSFAEEMIFRVGINGPLTNLLSPNKIFVISAVIFGVAHFQGMPSGIIGIILALPCSYSNVEYLSLSLIFSCKSR